MAFMKIFRSKIIVNVVVVTNVNGVETLLEVILGVSPISL